MKFNGHNYGMAVGKMEPRLGIFFNKRLFEEAGIDYGDVCYDLDARALTPTESVEKVQQLWQTFLDTANGVESVAQ